MIRHPCVDDVKDARSRVVQLHVGQFRDRSLTARRGVCIQPVTPPKKFSGSMNPLTTRASVTVGSLPPRS